MTPRDAVSPGSAIPPGAIDFWARELSDPRHVADVEIVGRTVRVSSNEPIVLDAAAASAKRFSRAPHHGGAWSVTVLVTDQPSGFPPDDLLDQTRHAAYGDRMLMDLGPWGHAQIDHGARQAHALVPSALARRPYDCSRVLFDTILTNFLLRDRMGMLHAAALVRGRTCLLLAAPDGTGKSSLALGLTLYGWRLITESMCLIETTSGALQIAGFPTGIVRLRPDVAERYPELTSAARVEQRRGERKLTVDLTEVAPDAIEPDAQLPDETFLCLLARGTAEDFAITALDPDELRAQIGLLSIHVDEPIVWQHNLRVLDELMRRSRCRSIFLPADPSTPPADLEARLRS